MTPARPLLDDHDRDVAAQLVAAAPQPSQEQIDALARIFEAIPPTEQVAS